ncbi:hypothetical protein [Lihuaxuella thermophila]|uniref:Uncharacterized protein n=1 Tax=Lihuaxuella thermophila TaxID=1173111 RepID=A0A1H8FQU9_9BACL|nr:hypothetical protein [Lihuaxuella thermophila]SEN34082.1 hypothetical protein SAMN05444955_10921 [Lihuaxuella thermophila]
MLKSLKFIIPPIAILTVAGLVGFIGKGFASDQPEKTAFSDYLKATSQNSPGQGKSLIPHNAVSIDGLNLSSFSIPIFLTPDARGIRSYQGTSLSGILKPSDEKIWFMMNGNQPQGIVVANRTEPVKMGGKNRSKDLMRLYKAAKASVKRDHEIRYFEFEGQGIFVAGTGKHEIVYLSQGAAKLLNLPAGKKLSPSDVITGMKNRLQSFPR